MPLQTELRFRPRGYGQPPRRGSPWSDKLWANHQQTRVAQSAPTGPHSCPRHASEEEDEMLHPSWTVTARLPQHGWRMSPPQNWRMVSTTRSWKRRRSADPRRGQSTGLARARPSGDDEDQLGAGQRSQPSLLLPIQGLVVTVSGDHQRGDAAGPRDENP